MHPEVEKYWEQAERIHNEIFKWSEGLSDERLNWRPPGEDTNTLGNLMSHIMGGQFFSIVERVGGVTTNRDRTSEFRNPVTRNWLVERRAEVERRIRETLDKLTPADLGRVLKTQAGEMTVDKWLANVLSHFSGHMGQGILTRKLLNAQK